MVRVVIQVQQGTVQFVFVQVVGLLLLNGQGLHRYRPLPDQVVVRFNRVEIVEEILVNVEA